MERFQRYQTKENLLGLGDILHGRNRKGELGMIPSFQTEKLDK